MVIKWTNKHSQESGFVKSIDYKNKHFNNTFDLSEAKKFAKYESIEKAIAKLTEYGEAINNNFEVIDD